MRFGEQEVVCNQDEMFLRNSETEEDFQCLTYEWSVCHFFMCAIIRRNFPDDKENGKWKN